MAENTRNASYSEIRRRRDDQLNRAEPSRGSRPRLEQKYVEEESLDMSEKRLVMGFTSIRDGLGDGGVAVGETGVGIAEESFQGYLINEQSLSSSNSANPYKSYLSDLALADNKFRLMNKSREGNSNQGRSQSRDRQERRALESKKKTRLVPTATPSSPLRSLYPTGGGVSGSHPGMGNGTHPVFPIVGVRGSDKDVAPRVTYSDGLTAEEKINQLIALNIEDIHNSQQQRVITKKDSTSYQSSNYLSKSKSLSSVHLPPHSTIPLPMHSDSITDSITKASPEKKSVHVSTIQLPDVAKQVRKQLYKGPL